MTKKKECSRCKNIKEIDQFKSDATGRELATCKKCREYSNNFLRVCIEENCDKQPVYGKRGTNKREYCKPHAPIGYVDVTHQRCLHENCDKQSNYGKRETNKVEYCKTHAPIGYVNVKDKKCLFATCDKHPSYGKRGTNKAEYCKSHAPIGYVNVKHKRCLFATCETRPAYGKRGTNKAEYCKSHAPIGYVNVISKKCENENCSTIPNYGKPGYPPEYCVKHKTIHPLKYGKDDVKECTYCLAEIHYRDDYCPSCKQFNILGQTVKTHNKELEIKALLEEKFDSDIFNHDRTVTGGCSRKRPDFLLTTTWGNIVLEVVTKLLHTKNL